jgi:hypothetical protein
VLINLDEFRFPMLDKIVIIFFLAYFTTLVMVLPFAAFAMTAPKQSTSLSHSVLFKRGRGMRSGGLLCYRVSPRNDGDRHGHKKHGLAMTFSA